MMPRQIPAAVLFGIAVVVGLVCLAGALLATVVGLLVAVPCLFGYNWLATRIRHATIEMEGFADEFVTGVERNYSTD